MFSLRKPEKWEHEITQAGTENTNTATQCPVLLPNCSWGSQSTSFSPTVVMRSLQVVTTSVLIICPLHGLGLGVEDAKMDRYSLTDRQTIPTGWWVLWCRTDGPEKTGLSPSLVGQGRHLNWALKDAKQLHWWSRGNSRVQEWESHEQRPKMTETEAAWNVECNKWQCGGRPGPDCCTLHCPERKKIK